MCWYLHRHATATQLQRITWLLPSDNRGALGHVLRLVFVWASKVTKICEDMPHGFENVVSAANVLYGILDRAVELRQLTLAWPSEDDVKALLNRLRMALDGGPGHFISFKNAATLRRLLNHIAYIKSPTSEKVFGRCLLTFNSVDVSQKRRTCSCGLVVGEQACSAGLASWHPLLTLHGLVCPFCCTPFNNDMNLGL